MKNITLFLVIALLINSRTTLAESLKQSPEAKSTYSEIKKTFGFVPEFFKVFPSEAITGAWEEFKMVQANPNSTIPPRYKELIGLAVSAQIPCHYCVFFHTEAVKNNGGNSREISEAVAMSALTRHWSTWLNGSMPDELTFRKETDQMISFVQANMKNKEPSEAPHLILDNVQAVYKDAELMFGMVPQFVKAFPPMALIGAWKEMKGLQLNPDTTIPEKYKELIGLAVASQIPCRYCTYFHTQAAKLNGATDAQVNEAIVMASIVRHWSTVLNGMQINETTFKREVNTIFHHMKNKNKIMDAEPVAELTN